MGPSQNICISAFSHQRRTMRQKEQGILAARKRQMPRAAATRTKGPWSSTRRTRGEGLNEKQRSPQR